MIEVCPICQGTMSVEVLTNNNFPDTVLAIWYCMECPNQNAQFFNIDQNQKEPNAKSK